MSITVRRTVNKQANHDARLKRWKVALRLVHTPVCDLIAYDICIAVTIIRVSSGGDFRSTGLNRPILYPRHPACSPWNTNNLIKVSHRHSLSVFARHCLKAQIYSERLGYGRLG